MTLTAPPRLLLVHAHPDDESLWTGGTIAKYAARGVQITVVTCTLGEQGDIIPANLTELSAAAADQLGGYRVGELRSACTALRVTDHRFLGAMGSWRDSGMAGDPANSHPRAFIQGELDEQTARLRDVIAEVKPQVVVTYDANGGYGHPDHIRAHEITVAAASTSTAVARVFYAVQSQDATKAGVAELTGLPGMPFRLPEPDELAVVPDDLITTVIDISDHLPAKLRALQAHATQISVWQDEAGNNAFALSNGIAQPVLRREYFVLASGPAAGSTTDLFGGLGIAGTDHPEDAGTDHPEDAGTDHPEDEDLS